MKQLLVLSGGHPFEEEPFEEMIHGLGSWNVRHLRHPEAEIEVEKGAADDAEALLFYDMGGFTFSDSGVKTQPPSEGFKEAILRRFRKGKGAVALHHALAGWAEWPAWADMLGGRFLYQAGSWRGNELSDSGYRHDVHYQAKIVGNHPVTNGLPKSFPVIDELYLCPIDEESVTPLIRADYGFKQENFFSAANAVSGNMFSRAGWTHPDGSNLVGWLKKIGNASFVYLQFGDGPLTYSNPNVRLAIANALNFTSGD